MSENATAISRENEKGILVVRFQDDAVTELDQTIKASNELRELADGTGTRVLFSLSNVHLITSPGIAVLIELNRHLRSSGGELKICEAQPMVQQLFRSFGLEKALDIYSSREEAMAAFEVKLAK